MGINVNADICFGIHIGEPYERLPWHDADDKWDCDMEAWWKSVCGADFGPCPYSDENYALRDTDMEAWQEMYQKRRAVEEANRCPYIEVFYGHHDNAYVVLAVASSVT